MDANFEAMVRYKRGMNPRDLVDQLVAEGCELQAAGDAVVRVRNRIRARDRKRGFANLVFGLLIFAIGAAVTVWTMRTGSVFVFAYGALLVGAAMILTGAVQIVSAGKDRELAQL